MKYSEHLKISVDSADLFCATFCLRRAVGLQCPKYVMYPEKR